MDDEYWKQNHTRNGNDSNNWLEHSQQLNLAHTILYNRYKTGWKKVNAVVMKKGSATVKDFEEEGLFQEWEDSQLLWVSLMLMSYAVECRLKSLWIKKGNLLVKDGEYIGMGDSKNKKKEHNLPYLCGLVGVRLSSEENNLLLRLGKIATGIGRYPANLKWTNLQKEIDAGTNISWGPADDTLAYEFIEKINKMLLE
jgi:hypothetical protein